MPKENGVGQVTASRYDKKTLKLERPGAKDAGDGCCGEAECSCGDCDECKALMAKARLQRQNTLVTRIERRVLALLEAAATT